MTKEQYDEWTEASLDQITSVLSIPKENIYLKLRQRKPGRLGQYQKLRKQGHEFIVGENGLRFIVNLSDYLDTGLFLDHRLTRQMVREQSEGKKVLNLFAYTGSFSVYAAAGGADEVVSVDLSNTYLDWGRRNMELNGFHDINKYRFIHHDVIKYLSSTTPAYFDLVILDPPTFSNSKQMTGHLDIQRDHHGLIKQCLDCTSKGGKIIFSTNFSKLIPDLDGIEAHSIREITPATTPFDFQGKLDRRCWRIIK
jgi:23S rRNA (cytosine1962-C5)-methyltransferase